jgi:hypothetical protein
MEEITAVQAQHPEGVVAPAGTAATEEKVEIL